MAEDVNNKQCISLGSNCMRTRLNLETLRWECSFSHLNREGYVMT